MRFFVIFGAAMAGVVPGSFLPARPAPGQDGGVVGDGAPSKIIAFFPSAEACPSGWVQIPNLAGYTPMGTPSAGLRGVAYGASLGPAEVQQHSHNYSFSIDLGSKGVAGLGGGNRDGANSGTASGTFSTGPSSANIPYVQYRSCAKL